MSNTGKKILILGIVIAIAIAGILAFYPTIVAPPTDVPVNNLHKSSLEANINGFSDTESTIFNDSIYNVVVDKLEMYKCEGFMTEEEIDHQTKALVQKYLPIFTKLSLAKFGASTWRESDHKAMLKKFEAYPDKSRLDYDLTFLYGLRERVPLNGNGPRCMLLDGGELIVPTYFADELNFVDVNTSEVKSVSLNPDREETIEHKGEKYFNDATHCYQNWQSCNGCHPGDGRTDGMNWDLMNDGVGNSKNCKSMLYSHVTPKCMISGIRESAEVAVRAGFKFIQFYEPDEEMAKCVDAYLKSLRPVPSPYLVNGELSEKAKEGRKVFEKLKCGECHSGPYFTDLKMHRIGEDIEFEQGWDTPTLIEVWRTAPYLFDGRAATLEEVFSVHKHGIEKRVSKKDIEALTEYVNSL